MTDRASHRAAVEAGYASLAGYVEKWERPMTPDTSTQAMEAIAEYLEVLRQPYWADKVRIVAAERDNARRTALEDAAKAADEAYMRAYRSQDDGDLEPGTIAAAIRAMIEEPKL